MSEQINDTFDYKNTIFCISAVQFPYEFFSIQQLGLNPESESTDCWRGYVAKFSLHQGKLILKDIDTNNSNGKALPVAINGVVPDVKKPPMLNEDYRNWRNWHYRDINLILPYSGSVLITDSFLNERIVQVGFQSPLSYRKVIELRFDKGHLVNENDESGTAELIRNYEYENEKLPWWGLAIDWY